MDELAVVEPHGPDRIVATTTRRRSPALVAVMGRMRGRRQRRVERAPPRRRHARGRHDHARRLRRVGAQPPLPTDRRAVRSRRVPRPSPGTEPSSNGSEASVFLCLHHPRRPDRVGRPRADLGLRRRRVALARRWPRRSRRTRCSRGPIAASSPSYVAAAMVLGGAFVFTLLVVEPHTTDERVPDERDVQQLLPRARATHRTCCAPRSFPSSRRAARSCSRSSRSGSPARSRSGRAGASTRRSARSVRASCCSSRSPRSARAAGCWSRSSYAFAVGMYLLALHETDMTERRSWFHTAARHAITRAARRRARRDRDRARRRGRRAVAPGLAQHAVVRLPIARRRHRRRPAQGDDTHRQHPGQVARGSRARGVHRRHRRRAARVLAGDRARQVRRQALDARGLGRARRGPHTRRREPRQRRRARAEVHDPRRRIRTGCRPRTTRSRSTSRTRSSSRTRRRCTSSPTNRSASSSYEVTSEIPVLSESREGSPHRRSTPTSSRGTSTSPPNFPQDVQRPRHAVTEDATVAVGEGRRDRALPQHRRRLRLQRPGRTFALHRHARAVPLRPARGVLRAVRVGIRGDGALGRAPDAHRGRLLVRHTAERRVAHQEQGRARVARGVLHRARLGAARTDTGSRRQRRRAAPATRPQRPQESATQAVPETTTPTIAPVARRRRRRSGAPRRTRKRSARAGRRRRRRRPRSSVGQFFVALAFVAIALAVLALHRAARARRARDAALVAPPPRRRSTRSRARRVGASPRPSRRCGCRAETVGDSPRVRVAPCAGPRRRRRGPGPHGARATADGGVVRARSADARTMRTARGCRSTRSTARSPIDLGDHSLAAPARSAPVGPQPGVAASRGG